MHVLRRRLAGLACFCLSVISILGGTDWVYGQASVSPSADQIEMFRNLSPDQQQAILQSLGGAGGGLGGLSGLGGGFGQGAGGSSAAAQQAQRDNQENLNRRKPSDEDEEAEPLVPILKGDD